MDRKIGAEEKVCQKRGKASLRSMEKQKLVTLRQGKKEGMCQAHCPCSVVGVHGVDLQGERVSKCANAASSGTVCRRAL